MSDLPEFIKLADERAWVRGDLEALPADAFWSEGEAFPGAKGRGGVRRVTLDGIQGVSRDYLRGGALGFLLARTYFDPERPKREVDVLQRLLAQGVPVVRPLAALARPCRLGLRIPGCYRLRIITELVAGAMPLPAFLAAEPTARRHAVRVAGEVVAAAFAAGLVHPDLHPDNLVARRRGEDIEVRLLDLDRAVLRDELTPADRDRMLLRMARYLRRHAGRLPVTPGLRDLLRFFAGMGLERAARRHELERLAPAYAEELRKHGLS